MKPTAPAATRPGLAFLLVFVLLAAGIVATGTFYYRNYERHYRAEMERNLPAIADLKVGELVQWRKERLGGAPLLRETGGRGRATPASVVAQQIRGALSV